MIQRIQTIFLLLVTIILLAALGFPVWVSSGSDASNGTLMTPVMTRTISGETSTESYGNVPLAIILVVCAGLAVFSILKFNNRPLQMKLGMGISMLLSLFLGLTIYFTSDLEKTLGPGTYTTAFFMVAVAVGLNILANRFIKRDEDMVKDADRLR